MIVRIGKNGRSFKGAAAYYLHDKSPDPATPKEMKPTTDERVAFTATRNLVFDDPHQATAEMIRTAYAQNELKRANDISLAGRKCTEPVKTLSLSWHPDEKPTQDQMIETADKYLRHMGWQEHQALIIGHSDTAHPHVHITVNRVHPETGRVLDDRLEYKRSQSWALEYEKEMGRIWCENREENAKPRDERAPDRSANDNDLPHNVIQIVRPLELDYQEAEAGRARLFKLEEDLLKKEQRQEREAWFEEGKKLFKEARNDVWRQVKEEYQPQWRELFADRATREQDAEQHAAHGLSRAFAFAKTGDWDQAREAFRSRDDLHAIVAADFAQRAADLRAQQLSDTRDLQKLALDALKESRSEAYRELLARQQDERAEMREAHDAGERAAHLVNQTRPVRTANENANPVPDAPPHHANTNAPLLQENIAALGSGQAPPEPHPLSPEAIFVAGVDKQLIHALSDQTTQLELPGIVPATPEDRAAEVAVGNAATGAADLGAGAIGGTANYLADQLGELFAPTPPEVREAQAKATEKAREDAEASKPHNPFLKHAGMAENKAAQDREEKERDDYWDDRERRRER